MLCPSCKTKREKKAFLGKKICYKCQYAAKVQEQEVRKCKECGKVLPTYKWKTCGGECAEKSAIKLKKEYWVNEVNKNKKAYRKKTTGYAGKKLLHPDLEF
jgi:hypothetical protein